MQQASRCTLQCRLQRKSRGQRECMLLGRPSADIPTCTRAARAIRAATRAATCSGSRVQVAAAR
eukprot:641233-Alexandrium_andersonii.AAC.1